MKKLFLSLSVIGTFAVYSFFVREGPANTQALPPVTLPTSTPTNGSSSSTTNGVYKNGTYTGDVVDAFYGNIQVQVTIQAGKIGDVQFLQYPNDRMTSRMINMQAMPILKSEVIRAQTAQVDIVSGATDSSQAFIQSLGSALAQAK